MTKKAPGPQRSASPNGASVDTSTTLRGGSGEQAGHPGRQPETVDVGSSVAGLRRSGRRRLWHWVLLTTLGETFGFLVPGLVGAAVTSADWPAAPQFTALVAAGAVEGSLLGAAQAQCLYGWGVLPVRRPWVFATSLGAVVAWSLGLLPSTLGGLSWSPGTAVLVVLGGLLLLLSIPLAQYCVLRRLVRRGWRWIPINMVAWLLGISWTLAPSPLIDQTTALVTLVVVYAVAGLCMAGTVAMITGLGLTRLMLPQVATHHPPRRS